MSRTVHRGIRQCPCQDCRESPKFGLYLMSALTVLLATGLLRFVSAWYLQGKFAKLEALLSGLGAPTQ